ncbi:hypothetical protein BJY52DRAFT_1352457 [Lactarius psammicola]|nr:hypothetical protein BJY52DRAFT_1352457 [Lactarius psammicola]
MTMAEYFALVKQIDFEYLYSVTRQWFLIGFALLGPVTFGYDAPFGKFATPDSVLSIDGVKSWIVMELVSPLAFLLTTYLHPFSPTPLPLPSLARRALDTSPQFILVALYLVHYLNRTLISPLRTPSRSNSHLVVVSAAVAFNAPNGFPSRRLPHVRLDRILPGRRPILYALLGGHRALGGRAIAKGKARELLDDDGDRKKAQRPHYAIPHGGLYSLVSFPNYLCEWVEWFGFALAAGPFPEFALFPSAKALLAAAGSAQFAEAGQLLVPFVDSVSPPWVFLFVEITTMVPRAVRGHRWYHERFKDSYPRERRAVIPWLL